MKNIDETLEHDKKVLSEREDLIIRNMLISSIGLIATYGGYKKMDDYTDECISEQIKNGNCDEAYLLILDGIKNTLITEYKNRKLEKGLYKS